MTAALFAGVAAALSACGTSAVQGELKNGYLPHGVTDNSRLVTDIWVGSWIAALAVGALVLGLTFWCIAVYRKKKGDDTLPPQLQYNVPLEILYTVVPVLMVSVLFYWTAKFETDIYSTDKPATNVVNVVGKQWSWDINYVSGSAHTVGEHAQMRAGKEGVEATLPTLYLPVNERTEFQLTSRDVIHSFWVPQFLQKLDMIPGRVNIMQVTPTEEGTYKGKCAELCGAYHSQMLFNVKVVSRAEYDQYIKDLKANGGDGLLDNGNNRMPIIEKDEHKLENTGSN